MFRPFQTPSSLERMVVVGLVDSKSMMGMPSRPVRYVCAPEQMLCLSRGAVCV